MSKINSFFLLFIIFPSSAGILYLKIYDNEKIKLDIDKYDNLIAKNKPEISIKLNYIDTVIITDASGNEKKEIDSVLKSNVYYIKHINGKNIIDLLNYKFKIKNKPINQIEIFVIHGDKKIYFEINSSQLKYSNRLTDYLKSIDNKYYIFISGFDYQKGESLTGFLSTPILYIVHPY